MESRTLQNISLPPFNQMIRWGLQVFQAGTIFRAIRSIFPFTSPAYETAYFAASIAVGDTIIASVRTGIHEHNPNELIHITKQDVIKFAGGLFVLPLIGYGFGMVAITYGPQLLASSNVVINTLGLALTTSMYRNIMVASLGTALQSGAIFVANQGNISNIKYDFGEQNAVQIALEYICRFSKAEIAAWCIRNFMSQIGISTAYLTDARYFSFVIACEQLNRLGQRFGFPGYDRNRSTATAIGVTSILLPSSYFVNRLFLHNAQNNSILQTSYNLMAVTTASFVIEPLLTHSRIGVGLGRFLSSCGDTLFNCRNSHQPISKTEPQLGIKKTI